MEYPGAKFTRPIRLATLVFFISVFFLITPTIILYSAGYRFDFQNGLLKETGSLSVDVLPKIATVYLDGIKIDQTMPIRLNNVTPHKYSLRLSAPGYYDWEKQIEIHKNQTTYVKEFVMIKKGKAKNISKSSGEQLSLSNSGRYLAFTNIINGNTQVIIYDENLKTSKIVLTLSGKAALLLGWAPLSDYLAVSSQNAPYSQLAIINAVNGKVFTFKENSPIEKYIWGRNSEPQIYYSINGKVLSFTPRLEQGSPVTDEKMQDWYIDDGALWTLNYNSSTSELNITEDALGFKTTFAAISAPSSEPTSTLLAWKFETIKKHTVLLRDLNSERFMIVQPDKVFTINAGKQLFSKFNNWWLFWSPFELWTYSENDEPFLLNRSGARLTDVQPLDQFNTLALLRDGELYALFPYFYIERMLIGGGVRAIAVNPETRILYFSSSVGGIEKLNY